MSYFKRSQRAGDDSELNKPWLQAWQLALASHRLAQSCQVTASVYGHMLILCVELAEESAGYPRVLLAGELLQSLLGGGGAPQISSATPEPW